MNTIFTSQHNFARMGGAVMAMFSLMIGLVAPVFPQTAHADYWDDYGSYYTDYGYYDDGYASYDSYDYYADDGYGSYYYDDYSYGYDDNYSSYYDDSYYNNDYSSSYVYDNSDYGTSYDPYQDYYSSYQSSYSSYDYEPYYYSSSSYDYTDNYQYDSCGNSTCGCGGCNNNDPDYDAPEVTTKSATNIDEDSATLRCDVDPNGDTTDVWFEWGTSSSSLSKSTSQRSYSSSTTAEQALSGLSDDTTYYYRCVGRNDAGSDYGSVLSFHTEEENNGEEPAVETKSATDIEQDSARLRCYVNPNDLDTDVWFEYGETTSMNEDTNKRSYDDTETVEQLIDDLEGDTKYYFRCVGENDEGKVYGDRLYFTTDEDGDDSERPFVSTNQPSNVTASSATLNGYVNPQGDSDTERWFEYGSTLSLGYNTSRDRQGSSAGNFNEYVSGLQNNTTYYYRAAARNDAGTVYGSIVSFRTGDGGWIDNKGPVATTGSAVNVARTSARFTGNASVPTSAYTTAWFEWGTTQSLGRTTATQSVGSSSVAVNQSMFGLDYATTYYYRLVVQNTYGISRGAIVSFTTLGAPNDTPTRPVQPVSVKEYGARITKTVENIDYQNGSPTDVFAEKAQTLRFTIQVENTGDYTLEETTIHDLIPFYLEFANADESLRYDGTRREVVWYIGELRSGESREVTLDMVVTDDARAGMTIENVARLESTKHNEVSNSIFIRVTDNVEADAKANRNAGAAAAFFGWDGIFPDTLLGWLIFTILLLIIIVLIRQLVLFYNEHKAKRAMRYVPQAPVAPVAYQSAPGPYASAPATLPVAPVAYPTAPNTPQGTQTVFPMGPAGQQ
ncbi:MAG: DUF11 domain-containing protein [Candidatus Yonathbacteria bacterium]|nr:DUF11 domain-containing protein [Candidatus Yonathbacteria bacterium]NTW47657.1 DUF11 domain-containing protein [Candidatus Yonathbacteria bacterium]